MESTWVNWTEIPVNHFERARKFYETIFNIEIKIADFGKFKMGIFPNRKHGLALCFGRWYRPGYSGVLIYLNANPDLNLVLKKVEKAGGKVEMKKKLISHEMGYMALIMDSEGNKIALNSLN